MKQGATRTSMDDEQEDENSEAQTRASRMAKQKVLVRSHAMREEQSPPRAPSPLTTTSLQSKLAPQPLSSPVSPTNPVVVLSPSISRGNSPCRSPSNLKLSVSPNKKCSPRCLSPIDDDLQYRMRILNLENIENQSPRNEISSHNDNRRKLHGDAAHDSIDCIKEKSNGTDHRGNSNTLNVSRTNNKSKLRHQGSSQGSFEDGEYKDTTGIDLDIFIPETLNRNPKDRAFMLRIEKELISLARDEKRDYLKFPPMSSYQRMLVHRCAAYFGMDHNIEASGKCVVVNRTRNTRIPELPFRSHIKDEYIFSEEPRRSILKRESNSSDDYNFKSPERGYGMENRRSKSYEEREEEYEKVRKRIFKGQRKDMGSFDDMLHWSEVAPWSSTDSETSRYKLQLPDSHSRRQGKLLKVHSEEVGETMRPHVAKSYSFGGYGGSLNRGDSVSTHSSGPRLLTKQDSAASSVSWRLSPSSSGYKSQSQMSESVTPSPTSTPHMLRDSKRQDSMNSEYSNDKHESTIVWAATDLGSVPKGSLIINPQTGTPIKNPDGSFYHFDPNNIPSVLLSSAKSPSSPRKSPTSPRRPTKSSPPTSPKKKSTKGSPVRRINTTNSSTSPTLPYPSPVNMSKSFSFPTVPPDTNQGMNYPPFSISFAPSMFNDLDPSIISQPFVIPYNGEQPPAGCDGRIPLTSRIEVPSGWSMENPVQMMYPPPSNFWPQSPNYFQNQAFNQQRYPPPSHASSDIPTAFMAPHTDPNAEMMFPNQPQMPFAYAASQPAAAMYANQGPFVYNQNPFPNPHYPSQAATPTASFASTTPQNVPSEPPPQQVLILNDQHRPNSRITRCSSYDEDSGNSTSSHVGRPASLRGFSVNSGQNSTATNSPSAAVHTNFGQHNPRNWRQYPESHSVPCPYMPNNLVMMRPMGVRCSTPGTNRSSRSPTPASDACHFVGQRMPFPQPVIPNFTGIVQHDQPLQAIPQPVFRVFGSLYPQETQRHRRPPPRNYKPGLPPSGRQT